MVKHKSWIWSEHLEYRMSKRKIDKELIEIALDNPDEILPTGQNRSIYQKIIGNKLIRIVVEENTLVTVYLTSKIKKYVKGE
jgi:hypothetical protein